MNILIGFEWQKIMLKETFIYNKENDQNQKWGTKEKPDNWTVNN